jgi:hypothetical protein
MGIAPRNECSCGSQQFCRADYFVIEQHLRRYTQTTSNNPQPF